MNEVVSDGLLINTVVHAYAVCYLASPAQTDFFFVVIELNLD